MSVLFPIQSRLGTQNNINNRQQHLLDARQSDRVAVGAAVGAPCPGPGRAQAELGLPTPKIEEVGGCFRVTFYRSRNVSTIAHGTDADTNDTNHDTNDTNSDTNVDANSSHDGNAVNGDNGPLAVRLLSMIKDNNHLTIDDMARACHVSRPTVNRAIRVLKESGRLRRVGGTRGSWQVNA